MDAPFTKDQYAKAYYKVSNERDELKKQVEELEKELEEMTEDRNIYRSNSLDWQGEDED